MQKRICTQCGKTVLSKYNRGALCYACQSKRRDERGETMIDSPNYDANDMVYILDITPEQVRRDARNGKIPGRLPIRRRVLFRREVVDEWIDQNHVIARIPTSPLQEEAMARCENGDHDWLADDRFCGIACSSEEAATEISRYVIGAGFNRTCYFCNKKVFIPVS